MTEKENNNKNKEVKYQVACDYWIRLSRYEYDPIDGDD